MRGYFEIGIYCVKHKVNVGTLWRSAFQLGASGIFTIGKRFEKQSSDTPKAFRHIPLRDFVDINEFNIARPRSTILVGIEMGGLPLSSFTHPERALYILGAEDHGLSGVILEKCNCIISIEAVRRESYNVAVAGSIVMYHRLLQQLGGN